MIRRGFFGPYRYSGNQSFWLSEILFATQLLDIGLLVARQT